MICICMENSWCRKSEQNIGQLRDVYNKRDMLLVSQPMHNIDLQGAELSTPVGSFSDYHSWWWWWWWWLEWECVCRNFLPSVFPWRREQEPTCFVFVLTISGAALRNNLTTKLWRCKHFETNFPLVVTHISKLRVSILWIFVLSLYSLLSRIFSLPAPGLGPRHSLTRSTSRHEIWPQITYFA